MPLPNEKRPLAKKDIFKVVGDSGTSRYGGFFQEEPNAAWRDSQRVVNVELMRRTDATVQEGLKTIKSPILSTTYNIDPFSNEDSDLEVAEFVKDNLFNMRRGFFDFLRESLTQFEFGHAAFELMWGRKNDRYLYGKSEEKNDKIYIVDVLPRIQSSIYRWKLDDGSVGIVQLLSNDDFSGTEAQIPLEKLIVFTNDKEGDDITGIPVLRSAWKHFYIKDKLYRIAAISAERYGVGIPIGTLPMGAGEAESKLMEEMLSNMRTNEKGYILKPNPEYEVDILIPKGNPQADQIESQIMHHDRMILASMLSSFLSLGSTSSGSYSLSKTQYKNYIDFVNDKLNYIEEQIENQIIKKLLWYNNLDVTRCPTLNHTPLGDIDLKEFSETIKNLAEVGAIRNDARTKQHIHDTVGLPKINDDELEEMDIAQIQNEIMQISSNVE